MRPASLLVSRCSWDNQWDTPTPHSTDPLPFDPSVGQDRGMPPRRWEVPSLRQRLQPTVRLHHPVFGFRGKSDDVNNIQLLCGRCNRLRSNRYIG